MRKQQAARRMEIRGLVERGRVGSQEELMRLLTRRGYRVTQATVSRDLAALGFAKRADEAGERYAPVSAPAANETAGGLARLMGEFVLSIEASLNLVVLRTTPGGASTLAAALDATRQPQVLGTVAGDDTVLIITRGDGGDREAARLRRILAGN